MPTVNYCDYAAGDDSTGDGTAGNPYKTINKASTGLAGGDEVRCAKSADPSSLGGNLTFTDGSTSVATSVDMTGSLAAKDFVGLNTAGETWWEISSINATTITLVKSYSGTGGTGAGYKLGVTDTGSAGTSTTIVQLISASGSDGSLIKVSGGWNLAGTPAQDGLTWFWQSGSNKYGYGLYLTGKSYIEHDFDRVGFLRYNSGVYLKSSSNYNSIDCVTCNGCLNNGVYIEDSRYNAITSVVCCANSVGIYLYNNATFNTVTSPKCHSNTNGIQIGTSSNFNRIISAACNNNTKGFNFFTSSDVIYDLISPTCNRNTYGIYLANSCFGSMVVYNYSHDETTWNNAAEIQGWTENKQKIVSIQESESGGAARNRVYFYGGYTQNNAADARSGECLQFNPKSATYWIEQSFFVPAAASTARTVSIYLKDDSSFNGSVWLELWFNGIRITGPTEQTMTTSYQQFSIVGAAGNIPVAGVLELKVLVYGTAGCVYADDISYS